VTIPQSTDVLIVGGGNAAMCAAITAREQGADVVVLEHAEQAMRGGNSRHTRNLRAAHCQPVFSQTGSYNEDEFWQDLLKVTEGHTNEKLARLMIRESSTLLEWLHDRGIRYQSALRGTLSLDRTNAFFLGGGKTLLNAEYRKAASLGVRIFYESEVTDLELDETGFRSATVMHDGKSRNIQAKAVVVASGGFQANEAWMKEAWGDAAENFIIRGTPFNRGTMLKNLMAKGAETVGDPKQCHAVAIDARAPKYDGGIASRVDCVCFSIVVNQSGQRFYDEGEDFWPRRYAIWGRLVAQQPKQVAYAIIDSKVVEQFMPSMFPEIKADSIEALANEIGVDAAVLASTVEEFNTAVLPGNYDATSLDDCHTADIHPSKSHWALKLDTPPYFAFPLRPGITFTYLGLKVDENARVSFGPGRPVENVFAAGEVMAGNILGKGYCAGTGMTIGTVFGRIAGENAVSIGAMQ
jgi:tricarballylate dehydrogenase